MAMIVLLNSIIFQFSHNSGSNMDNANAEKSDIYSNDMSKAMGAGNFFNFVMLDNDLFSIYFR